ncbi:hypothetical protein BAE44_0005443 [Dichanthelium oligosanthes]|uniref:Uncharacterized protein n=1 Tax=Dichanthelium oligosanthes TaxID=888268 RepID=A0A1E5W840_9POAL|nr:hypothetical protein BAE44_0005443 [Dichanthelium oligosanthes]
MPAGAADHHCRILGSHLDALLFSMYVPLPDPMYDRCRLSPEGERPPRFFKQELFVYIAGSMPSFTPLPPCTGSPEEVDEGDMSSRVMTYQMMRMLLRLINKRPLSLIGGITH